MPTDIVNTLEHSKIIEAETPASDEPEKFVKAIKESSTLKSLSSQVSSPKIKGLVVQGSPPSCTVNPIAEESKREYTKQSPFQSQKQSPAVGAISSGGDSPKIGQPSSSSSKRQSIFKKIVKNTTTAILNSDKRKANVRESTARKLGERDDSAGSLGTVGDLRVESRAIYLNQHVSAPIANKNINIGLNFPTNLSNGTQMTVIPQSLSSEEVFKGSGTLSGMKLAQPPMVEITFGDNIGSKKAEQLSDIRQIYEGSFETSEQPLFMSPSIREQLFEATPSHDRVANEVNSYNQPGFEVETAKTLAQWREQNELIQRRARKSPSRQITSYTDVMNPVLAQTKDASPISQLMVQNNSVGLPETQSLPTLNNLPAMHLSNEQMNSNILYSSHHDINAAIEAKNALVGQKIVPLDRNTEMQNQQQRTIEPEDQYLTILGLTPKMHERNPASTASDGVKYNTESSQRSNRIHKGSS